ncbi:MAG: DUF262 domain-containing protein [Methylomonas sp.]|jgi:uncharacterized protein with ParB-like and HNH nuclease domain/5-methylcytosine-specific restriction endonuclease McrA
MNIISMLNQIQSNEIVLPAIQREFVWSEEKIAKLMESIMRGYPIGIVLMWETYKDIQFRRFVDSYQKDETTSFFDNTANQKLKLVLDGQQRLQSLYISLYGQHNGKYLYFDILSGRDSDDFEEEKYIFYFGTKNEADEWNNEAKKMSVTDDRKAENLAYYVKVSELFRMDVAQKQQYRKSIVKLMRLNDEEELRLETNLATLDEVFTKDQNILKASIIDENKPSDSQSRQTESDVLEIFVRINRQGIQLSRSDLIFSMLKLNWKESATALPDFVKKINEGNSFDIDIDFVIRCLFAVSDLGSKFDLDMLRKKSNMKKLQSNFEQCCAAIEATVDSVQKYCWVSNNKVIGGNYNLVPFVYYLFHIKGHDVPNNQIQSFKKAFFLFGFSGPFSRYADSRLAKFIKDELSAAPNRNMDIFPLEAAIKWVNYWEAISDWNKNLVQRNPKLALCIVQQDTGHKTQFYLNSREMDHIFPRSTLKEKGVDEAKINHFANFWFLSKTKNINKTNKPPKKYFEDVDDNVLASALIDRDLLNLNQFKAFLDKRGDAIMKKLTEQIGFSSNDFDVLKK